LGKTVVLIVADYKLFSSGLTGGTWWGKEEQLSAAAETSLRAAEEEMQAAQHDYERLSLAVRRLEEAGEREGGTLGGQTRGWRAWWVWWRRGPAATRERERRAAMEALEKSAKEARQRLLTAAARLSRVEEHAKGVSQKGKVYQRMADRLLELCQLNLGCCEFPGKEGGGRGGGRGRGGKDRRAVTCIFDSESQG
jgi:hypothetical protein